MEQRKMAAIFLGASMLLLGVYVFANRGVSVPQQNATKQQDGLFSGEGSAIADQNSGNGWGDLLSGDSAKESPEDKNNATKNIAKVAFDQMKALDQQGKSPFDKENVNTSDVQASIESSIGTSVDSFFASAVVSDREIKTSANNTKKAKIAYLKSLEGILSRNKINDEYKSVPGGLQGQVEAACKDGDSGINKSFADTYAAIAKEFIAVRVPSGWIDFHKQTIGHYRQGNIIFDAFSKCVNDPLRGYVAIQKLSVYGMDAATLQNMLKKMYNEVGL